MMLDLASATPAQRAVLRAGTRPRSNAYIDRLLADGRVRWQGKQQAGLLLGHIEELLFGGAAGGGKSAWLLLAALQYVDVPGYNAVLFRRTYVQLSGADGLIELSHEWLDDTDARWHPGDAKWTFPAGGTLWFRHMGDAQAHTNYQGLAYGFVGFDELTQFSESQYTYVAFSRGRRRADSSIPTRIRATSNPGGIGHEWVRSRFGIYKPEGDTDPRRLCERSAWVRAQNGGAGRAFLPSRVSDNPSLDRADYIRRMGNLDSTTRQQLLDGDWDARLPGELFQRAWFETVDRAPDGTRWVRFWDFAATEASPENPDPDWTAGVKVGRHPNGTWYIGHVLNVRKRPQAVEALVAQTAELDGIAVPVRWEEEGGASGKAYSHHLTGNVLAGFDARGVRPQGDKVVRAKPVSAKAEARLVKIVRGPWNHAYLDQMDAFTTSDEHGHDDMVDATSGGFQVLARPTGARTTGYMPGFSRPVRQAGDLRLVGEHYVDQD